MEVSPTSSHQTLAALPSPLSPYSSGEETPERRFGERGRKGTSSSKDIEIICHELEDARRGPTRRPDAQQRPPHGFDYKPTALRWWFLAGLISCLVVLLALTEYSAHVLPEFRDDDLSRLANLTQQKIFGRASPITNISTSTTSSSITSSGARPPPATTSSYLIPGQHTTVTTTTMMTSPMTMTSYVSAPDSGYLHTGPATITSLCITCTLTVPAMSTAGSAYLTPGQVITQQTTDTTVIVHTEIVAPTTTTIQTVFVDQAGSTRTTAIPTTIPASTRTVASTVVIPPGMALTTMTTAVPTTLSATTATTTSVFTGADGVVTSEVILVPGSGTVSTVAAIITTVAAAQPSGPANATAAITVVVGITAAEYWVGAFLPTILAVLIVLPLKLIDINVKLFQPFHALVRQQQGGGGGGAAAESSIFLRFYGWPGLLAFPRAFRLRQPAVVVSQLVVFLAALLAPIAAESVAVHVEPGCTGGCYGSLGVSAVPARALEALMAAIALLLLALVFLLGGGRWLTGVRQNPWSLAGMACLAMDREVRALLRAAPRGLGRKIDDHELAAALKGRRFGLGPLGGGDDGAGTADGGYGLVIEACPDPARRRLLSPPGSPGPVRAEGKKRIMSFAMLTWWGRGLMLFAMSCIFIILVYYENTSGDTGFERFMDSQGFGVRFFFTALGVVMGFAMATFFRCECFFFLSL